MVALTRQWEGFCDAISMPELKVDPRFNDPAIRIENRFELAKIIEQWMSEQASDDAVQKILEDARIPVAPILEVEEDMAHPHLIRRETVRTI
ncbi:MAG: hypothetical protein COA75_03930 [Cellvibrionales bacterium]|nr:MAG: hypothetical protein COA75_03930 [Cellvibrionales bacterium]